MKSPAASSSKRRYLVAMVLGTTLTAVGAVPGQATLAPEAAARAASDISRYCTACWRNARLHPDAWTDCTQEVFGRLLERVQPAAWGRVLKVEGEERRELLRAIDAVKKRTQRGRKFSPCVAELVVDSRDAHDRKFADDREVVRRAAAALLSSRQQRILQLSFEGWSVQEVADELQLGVERVSDEKYKAVRKLRGHLMGSEG